MIATRLPAGWLLQMLLGMGLAARPAIAQLQVTITGSGGASVAGAQVELWHGATRIAVRVADRAGRARFSADEAGEATVVQVRRIGFAPMRTSRPPETRELVLVLEPLARALPRVRVASQQSRCPQREDLDARSAWESSRQRYDDTSSLGRAAILEYSAGEVGQDSIGLIDPEHLLGGVRGSNRPAIRGLRQDVAEHGYAWMLPPRHYYYDYGVWGYPVLEADYAQHFSESLFGARHTFVFGNSAVPDEVILRFCPRNRRRSGLVGTLHLGRDGSFVSARWEYWNPKHDAESAGGEVVFSTGAQFRGSPVLTAASGLFWRRLPNRRYYQRYQLYAPWALVGGDTLPRLADRR